MAGPRSRCLVPFTSFCDYADTKPKKTPKWFALDKARLLVAFAGIWTERIGVRGTKSNPRSRTTLSFRYIRRRCRPRGCKRDDVVGQEVASCTTTPFWLCTLLDLRQQSIRRLLAGRLLAWQRVLSYNCWRRDLCGMVQQPTNRMERRLSAILAADVAGY